MIHTELEKLHSRTSKHLSIGITEKGEPVNAVAIPWSQHSSAFNMRTPDIFLCEKDLHDEDILCQLDNFNIIGFYAFCELKDYDVLERFTDLEDIFLANAFSLKNISFAAGMKSLFMLFIHGATLPNLDPLLYSRDHEKSFLSCRIGLYNCRVADISLLTDSKMDIYELLIWNKWSKAEDARWRSLKPLVYHYYRLDK